MATTDTDTRTSGVMVAFSIPLEVAKKLVLPGGDPPGQLHCTLAFFGKEDELTDSEKYCLRNLSHRLTQILETFELKGVISGLGYFQNKNKNQECLYASLDIPGLNSVYDFILREAISKNLPMKRDHGFTPHCTLRYQPVGTPRPTRRTPLPQITLGPPDLVCKIGEEVSHFDPKQRSICPRCSYDDCICTELASTEKSFRAYVGNTRV